MRTVRFQIKDRVSYGLVEPRAGVDTVSELKGDRPEQFALTGRVYPLREVKLLAPVVPSKVVCIGLNYRDHARELGMAIPSEPVIFLKPPSCIVGPGETVVMPPESDDVQYEAELAIVISREARKVLPEDADKYIWGFTCFNDVTARDLQAKDAQWTRAKSFDSFGPVGPWVVDGLDPADLEISCYRNDERVQHSRTSEFIFSVQEIVAWVSQIMTLLPGDIISTGTPSGVGPVVSGDIVTVEIQGIGRLENPFRR